MENERIATRPRRGALCACLANRFRDSLQPAAQKRQDQSAMARSRVCALGVRVRGRLRRCSYTAEGLSQAKRYLDAGGDVERRNGKCRRDETE
jgi:hypothetical protein